MHKLSLIHFYKLGKEMRTLREANKNPHRAFSHLSNKGLWLSRFLVESNEVPFPKTRHAALELERFLSSIFLREHDFTQGIIVTDEEDLKMKILLEKFEQEFEHDSREINILSVPDRCAYSTTILIENGESLLPPDVRDTVSDYVRNEFHEAGKCLAFNVSTAAGFHLARGLESALRSYYDVLSSGADRPKTPSGNDIAMKGYINAVGQWADTKVISVLEQFTNLHRNPINHPEAVLTDNEAIALVGITVSCVIGMVNDVKSKGHAFLFWEDERLT